MRTIAFLQVREWNFKEPIYIGDTIRIRSKVMEKNLRGRGRRGEIVWYRVLVNQEGKVVQEGILVTLVEGRASIRNRQVPEPTRTANPPLSTKKDRGQKSEA